MSPSPADPSRLRLQWLAPLTLLILACLVLVQYDPFRRRLDGDPAITSYIALMAARNVPPHLGVYDVKASLSPLLGALVIRAAERVGVPNILALRAWMIGMTALCVVLMYFIGTAFSRVRLVGIVSALILLGMAGFARRAALGIEPKTVMLFFALLALDALMRRRWFWAGVWGACAGLTWQVGFGYAALAVLLAWVQTCGTSERGRAASIALAGILIPLALYVAYFAVQGALTPMVQQSVLAFFYGRGGAAAADQFAGLRLLEKFVEGYTDEIIFGALAVIGWIGSWTWIILKRRVRFILFENPRTGGTLLAFHGLLLFSFIDFQNYPDWIPLLPFVALFAAIALVYGGAFMTRRLVLPFRRRWVGAGALVVVVLLVALWDVPWSRNVYSLRVAGPLADQLQVAQELNRTFAPTEPLLILGKDEFLFFMGREPLTRYTFLLQNTDAVMDAFEPRGFAGWLAEVGEKRPAFVALDRLTRKSFAEPEHYVALRAWVTQDYVQLKACAGAGDGDYYVRADLGEPFAHPNSSDCFTR